MIRSDHLILREQMVKCTKGHIRRLKTAPRWKIPAPNHRSGDLVLPGNISSLFLPPCAPELNLKENPWDEIRGKIFKNHALKSVGAARAKLRRANLSIERNPKTVKSITSFPYIVRSL